MIGTTHLRESSAARTFLNGRMPVPKRVVWPLRSVVNMGLPLGSTVADVEVGAKGAAGPEGERERRADAVGQHIHGSQ